MKNKEITMLELFKLIAEGNPPKKIHWKYSDLNDDTYIWYDHACGYYEEGHAGEMGYKLLAYRNEQFSKILNSIVEILPEENDEWEDIEELKNEGRFKFYDKKTGMSEEIAKILDAYFEALIIKINELVKNQKYLKEKLENKDE